MRLLHLRWRRAAGEIARLVDAGTALTKLAEERGAIERAGAGAETKARQAAVAARRAETATAALRERRAGLQARRETAEETLGRLRAEIRERLGVGPDEFGALALPGDKTRDQEGMVADLAARLDRLARERNAMGPVNLLAAREAAEIEARFGGIERDRADLTAAIARLRRGIAALDQEGRRRLTAAFEALNGNFGRLFMRLFGGGQAELAWAGGDDPLDAGLEILASPPGKRLASLLLLSGGEQR
jgi:chromosome segregation protein